MINADEFHASMDGKADQIIKDLLSYPYSSFQSVYLGAIK